MKRFAGGILRSAMLLLLVVGLNLSGGAVTGAGLSAQDYPHGTFPEGLDCLDCHTTEGWTPIQETPVFNHGRVTGFPLVGRHAAASCRSCHEDLHFENASATPEECSTCHLDVHAGTLPSNCSLCHTPTSYQDVSGIRAHQGTGFVLEGAHLQLSCESCHSDDLGGSFRPLQTDCLACHREDYEASPVVDHEALGFPATCLICHTPQSWMDIGAFDHALFSGGFALQESHQNLQCTACHVAGGGLRFTPADQGDCAACHQADYQREHGGSGYPQTCSLCHGQDSWDRGDFDHISVSGGFVLAGSHQELVCTSCHTADGTGLLFNPADQNDCVACHQGDYQEEHAGSGYPTTCLSCHTPDSWDGANIDHLDLSGGFELVGDHGELSCTNCHTPDGSGTLFDPSDSDDCVACHQADYQEEHSGSGFPTTCLSCHQVTTWDGAAIDHGAISDGFVLPSDHEELDCTSCHTADGSGTLFSPSTPEDCVACHMGDYQGEHSGTGYPTECLVCHTTSTWDGATIDHGSISDGFVLPSDHGDLECNSCHTADGSGTLFSPATPDDCVACHQDDYQEEHAGSGYPTNCTACHTTSGWDGVSADHAALSGGFDMVGNHDGLPCTSCHTADLSETLFDPSAPDDCQACHLADYVREHSGSGYPTTCLTCHQVTTWDGATVDHGSISDGFVLPSDHGGLDCSNCHTADGSGTLFSPSDPDDCVACHQDEYQAQHTGSGYTTDCTVCHTTSGWEGVSADHSTLSGGFGLVGNHDALPCTSCHTADLSATLFDPSAPDDCQACHQADFQREHSGSGFPLTCLSCHQVTTWTGATVDHTAVSGGFDLLGNHDLLPCSSCHVIPSYETLFTPTDPEDCMACHQADFVREHAGSNYPTSCLTCHVITSWDGADFNHDRDYFPISSGKHQGEWPTCQTCHTNPTDYEVFFCLNCHKHNPTDTNEDHSEVPDYVYESGNCLSCHPTGTS